MPAGFWASCCKHRSRFDGFEDPGAKLLRLPARAVDSGKQPLEFRGGQPKSSVFGSGLELGFGEFVRHIRICLCASHARLRLSAAH